MERKYLHRSLPIRLPKLCCESLLAIRSLYVLPRDVDPELGFTIGGHNLRIQSFDSDGWVGQAPGLDFHQMVGPLFLSRRSEDTRAAKVSGPEDSRSPVGHTTFSEFALGFHGRRALLGFKPVAPYGLLQHQCGKKDG